MGASIIRVLVCSMGMWVAIKLIVGDGEMMARQLRVHDALQSSVSRALMKQTPVTPVPRGV